MLLRRILNHVAKQQELSYSFLKEIASSTGVRLSNDKAQTVFAILKNGLIMKTKNYSRCAVWSIGNLYAVTENVQFGTKDEEPKQRQGEQDEDGRHTESSSNYTISRFWTNESLYEPLDMMEINAEVARLRSDKRFTERIRASRQTVPDAPD